MLSLKLRDEFLGAHTPGTMISLRDDEGKGAAEIGPDYILAITYPTADVQTALRNVSKSRASRPIVLMGGRGRGKSHIMAVIHHALASPEAVEKWAHDWGKASATAVLTDLELESSYFPISEPVHNQEYPLLWDLLFDRHPKGDYYRGMFLGQRAWLRKLPRLAAREGRAAFVDDQHAPGRFPSAAGNRDRLHRTGARASLASQL